MALKFCSICNKEMPDGHDCFAFYASSFSLELELLKLPFDIEPYGQVEEPTPVYVESPKTQHDLPVRPAREQEDSGIRNGPTPLFLRL